MTQAKFGGSVGIMSAARPKFQIMERDFSEGKLCDNVVSGVYYICVTHKMYYMHYATSNLTICDKSKASIYINTSHF